MGINERYEDITTVYKLWEDDVRRLADLDDAKIAKLEEQITMLANAVCEARTWARRLYKWKQDRELMDAINDAMEPIYEIKEALSSLEVISG